MNLLPYDLIAELEPPAEPRRVHANGFFLPLEFIRGFRYNYGEVLKVCFHEVSPYYSF